LQRTICNRYHRTKSSRFNCNHGNEIIFFITELSPITWQFLLLCLHTRNECVACRLLFQSCEYDVREYNQCENSSCKVVIILVEF
jgi:hypothetical protein